MNSAIAPGLALARTIFVNARMNSSSPASDGYCSRAIRSIASDRPVPS
jgi:hypothetical protein